MTWLAGSILGLPRYVWLALLVAVAGIVIITINHKTDRTIDMAKDVGGLEAVSRGQETTLDQVGKANEASKQIRNSGDPLKYDTCLRDSAPGYEGSCERYKPNEPLPD